MKISPIATEMIVSQYTRNKVVGPDMIHNVVITHKEIGGNEKVEEISKIYDRSGKIREIDPSKKIDYEA